MIDLSVETADFEDGNRSFGVRLVWNELSKGDDVSGWVSHAITAINVEAFNQSYAISKWYVKTYKTRLAVFGVGQLCSDKEELGLLKLLYGFGDGVLKKKGGK
jgi:hypothetical protein